MIEKCPECDMVIDLMPMQKPIPESTSTMAMTVNAATYDFGGPSYASTRITYKCANPKCWVTKIEESWS